MRSIAVDFAHKRSLPIMVVALLAAALLGTASWSAMEASRSRWALARLERNRLSLKASLAVLPVVQPASRTKTAEPPSDDGRPLMREVALKDRLADIEAVQINGIQVLGIEVQPAEGSFRLELTFQSEPALLRYLSALNADGDHCWALQQMQTGSSPPRAVAMGVTTSPCTAS